MATAVRSSFSETFRDPKKFKQKSTPKSVPVHTRPNSPSHRGSQCKDADLWFSSRFRGSTDWSGHDNYIRRPRRQQQPPLRLQLRTSAPKTAYMSMSVGLDNSAKKSCKWPSKTWLSGCCLIHSNKERLRQPLRVCAIMHIHSPCLCIKQADHEPALPMKNPTTKWWGIYNKCALHISSLWTHCSPGAPAITPKMLTISAPTCHPMALTIEHCKNSALINHPKNFNALHSGCSKPSTSEFALLALLPPWLAAGNESTSRVRV